MGLSVGIDVATASEQVGQKCHVLLPVLKQQLALLSNLSCGAPGQIHLSSRYLVPGASGQLIFDSGFEKYSGEIIQKFLVREASKRSSMDVDFLQSLGKNAIRLSAKVKVGQQLQSLRQGG